MTKARDLSNIISGGFTESDIPNLAASKITSGTLDNARISLDEAEIPSLNASKIGAGTLADARLPSTALNSNVDLTNLSASNMTSGTLPDARFPATLPAVSGANLTSLPVSSDFVKITTTTISSSVSSVSLDGHFSSTYKNYQIVGTGLIFSDSYFGGTSGQGLKGRVRQSNADKTDGQYIWSLNRSIAYFNGNLTDNNDGAYNSDHFKIIGRNNSGNQFTGNFTMSVYDPLGTSYRKAINWQTSNMQTVDNSSGNLALECEVGSTVYRGNTTALSGFTFFPASGNLTGGTITIYGFKQ